MMPTLTFDKSSQRSDNPLPFVSVVVPFYNSQKTIVPLLISLLNLTYQKEKFEIILVDDGSTDNTTQELATFLHDIELPTVKILHNERKEGPSSARNKGIRESKGDIIAFTDSDTIPDVNWLRNLVEGFDAADVGGVRGETTTDGYMLFPIRVAPISMKNGYKTCNMAYRKDALLIVGLFDEKFRHPYAEDGDVAHRILDSGFRIVDVPSAVVLHPIKKRKLTQTINDALLRRYDVLFFRKHPKEAKNYGERFMRPILTVSGNFGLSPAGILLFLYLGLLVTSFAFGFLQVFIFELVVVGVLILLALTFLAMFGYRRVTLGIPPRDIPLSERLACSIGLVVFYLVTCLARLFGSLEFRVLMV